ncbi:hypothetical protein [Montanilutibacter psychrotolerans]|uniref:Uncharacterized protein n=1 Tax=Montanilutibacter psychrotolerans TaxID=1327343 RepID=A0A3M8SXX9_9GAMM|nr:hypothetical protein [Lysobacter psychrotolerans]RNF86231.1 hypothetical protein EER27_02070 [Lysobacter psychrotolerans]
MNFDGLLKDAWQGVNRPATPGRLAPHMRRHQLRHRLQRAIEIALTLAAVLVFGRSLMTGSIEPSHWLLLPFFVVYLPIAWAFVLRVPRQRNDDVTENTRLYAQLRMAQLRVNLRDLWLARTSAWILVVYAFIANTGVWLIGGASWQRAALTLLGFALAWGAGTLWFVRKLRRTRFREYRAVRRLTGA